MLPICAIAAVCVLLVAPAVVGSRLQTRWNPVVVNVLKRTNAHASNTSVDIPGRTSPVLFQQIMGLQPGAPFHFNLEKWRALVTSGLFHNVSVQTCDSKLGAYLNITGYEAPSVTLSPEVTVTASLNSPEIHGGVAWKDSNFRGMGDTLELTITKKEGLEDDLLSLDPTLSLRWTECSIGKSSRVSVSHEEDNAFDALSNLLPVSVQRMISSFNADNILGWRQAVRSSSTSAQFISAAPPSLLAKKPFGLRLRSALIGLEPFIRRQTSSIPLKQDEADVALETADLRTTALGAKLFAEAQVEEGPFARMSLESGHLHNSAMRAKAEPFHQATAALHFPSVVLRRGASAERLGAEASEPGVVGKAVNQIASMLDRVDCVGRFKFQGMRSWGSGCTAGQQLSASSSKQYVRCLPLAERAAGIASAQVDVYLKNLLSYGAVLGAFLDTGIVAPAPGLATDGPDSSPITGRRSASAVNGVATGGLSLRLMGFRVDYGAPLQSELHPQVRIGLDLGD